jgi:hypothetical protein
MGFRVGKGKVGLEGFTSRNEFTARVRGHGQICRKTSRSRLDSQDGSEEDGSDRAGTSIKVKGRRDQILGGKIGRHARRRAITSRLRTPKNAEGKTPC